MDAVLEVSLAGVRLKNPLVLASGLQSIALIKRFVDAGIGAVTTKTVTPEPRQGHPPPTLVDVGVGYINAVGLKNPGVEAARREVAELARYAHEREVAVIGSAAASTAEGYAKVAEALAEAGADIVELNVSCPTVLEVYSVGQSLEAIKEVVREVKRAVSVPVSVKLSPTTPGLVRAVSEAIRSGADMVTIANTLSPATSIDIWKRRVRLGNPDGYGGLSGPAVKPFVVALVMKVYESTGATIIASGGATTWQDVVEYMLAGATAVSFLSAFFSLSRQKGVGFVAEMLEGLRRYLAQVGARSAAEIVGGATARRRGVDRRQGIG